MQCSQAKPFTMTSSNPKMGGAAIKSYEKGGMVTKPKESGVYTAEMGRPPQDIDSGSAPRKSAKPKESGIYTAEMGRPPQDIDGGSAPRKPAPAPKKK